MKWLAAILLSVLVCCSTFAGEIEDALHSVRDIKADMYDRASTVFGQLPGPQELADQQRLARPVLRPTLRPELRLSGETGKQMQTDADAFLANLNEQASRNFGPIPMGISGAIIHDLQTHSGFCVLHVLPGTPADGILKKKDVILGANGRLFQHKQDPRPELGYELAASQSSLLKGVLTVHLVRDGNPLNVTIDLGDQTYFSEAFPQDCAKTRQMGREVLNLVLNHSGKSLDIFTPLFLLSSQDPEAILEVRTGIYEKLVPEEELADYAKEWKNTWRVSYDLIAFAEYYLMTGDSLVLPTMRAMCEALERNQFESGSWSHNRPGGYGEINNAGLAAFIGLILARECGLEVDEQKLARSIRYFGRYCGSSIFYGVDLPVQRGGTNDNGMPAMAAVAFNLLGEREMADRWAQSMSYRWMVRQKGHAEACFGLFWQPIGAALGPRELEQVFMDQNIWMVELARTPDRGMVYFRGSRAHYPDHISAAMGSFLYMHNNPLRIMGREKGALSLQPPDALTKARSLLLAKQWDKAREAVAKSGMAQSDYARRLTQQLDWIEAHLEAALKTIDQNIKEGKTKTAALRLDNLVRYYGSEPDPAKRLRKRLPEAPEDSSPSESLVYDTTGLGDGLKYKRDFAEDPIFLNRNGFESMPSKQVASFLGHCHSYVYQAALQTLVSRDEHYAGLIAQMLVDQHPYIRSGGIALYRETLRSKFDNQNKPDLSDEQYQLMVNTLRPILNDTHADVQLELIECVRVFGSRDQELDQSIVRIAKEGALIARLRLVDALGRIQDEQLRLRIRRAILRSPLPARRSNNYNNCMEIAKAFRYDWDAATLDDFSIPDKGLETLNDMAYHVRYVLDGPAGHSDILIHLAAAAWSPEVEQLEHMVPAMVRLFVRSRQSQFWVAYDISRFLLRELFHHVDKDRLRAAIEIEREWFENASDETFIDRFNRDECRESFAELDRILAGEQTDRPDKGVPIKPLVKHAPDIPILVTKLRDGNHTRWSMPIDASRLRYERRRGVTGLIKTGSKRTGGYIDGIDMLAIHQAVENVSTASGLTRSEVLLAKESKPIAEYQNKLSKGKYIFLVSVTTPRLRFAFGNKFVCLGDALVFESREDKLNTIEPDQPHVLASAGFYASFDIPPGVEEGSEEWNSLVEKEIGQAFYEQVLVPITPKLDAYGKKKQNHSK